MIALFKSHASLGGSLLKNEDILEIQEQHHLKQVVVVEDTFYGFRELNKKLTERGVSLIFGIRLSVKQNAEDECSSKLVFFAKNGDGIRQIRALYTKTHCSDSGTLVLGELKPEEFADIKVAVPFYDSFIYRNIFHFGVCNIDLGKFEHFFFEEDNDHPFDSMISERLKGFSGEKVKAKSIYYRNRDDIDAFMFYKASVNRSGGKPPSFDNPNLEHFCSPEFCWESYLEKTKQ